MLSTCVPILRSTCSRSSLRAAKAVRAQMMSMHILLAADPDIRVIHLLRDPRAVVSSRRKMGDSIVGQYSLSTHGFQNSSNLARREAEIYCRTAVNDIRVRRVLEVKYPGRILALHYEDVVADLSRHADLIYRFLGVDNTPKATLAWIQQNNAAKAKATASRSGYLSPLEKWKKHLAPAESAAIVNICREYFQYTDTGSRQSSWLARPQHVTGIDVASSSSAPATSTPTYSFLQTQAQVSPC